MLIEKLEALLKIHCTNANHQKIAENFLALIKKTSLTAEEKIEAEKLFLKLLHLSCFLQKNIELFETLLEVGEAFTEIMQPNNQLLITILKEIFSKLRDYQPSLAISFAHYYFYCSAGFFIHERISYHATKLFISWFLQTEKIQSENDFYTPILNLFLKNTSRSSFIPKEIALDTAHDILKKHFESHLKKKAPAYENILKNNASIMALDLIPEENELRETMQQGPWTMGHSVVSYNNYQAILRDGAIISPDGKEGVVFMTMGFLKAPLPHGLRHATARFEFKIDESFEKTLKMAFLLPHLYCHENAPKPITPATYEGVTQKVRYDNKDTRTILYESPDSQRRKTELLDENVYGNIDLREILVRRFILRCREVGGSFYKNVLKNRNNPPVLSNYYCEMMHSGLFEVILPVYVPLTLKHTVTVRDEDIIHSQEKIFPLLQDIDQLSKSLTTRELNPNKILTYIPNKIPGKNFAFMNLLDAAIYLKNMNAIEKILEHGLYEEVEVEGSPPLILSAAKITCADGNKNFEALEMLIKKGVKIPNLENSYRYFPALYLAEGFIAYLITEGREIFNELIGEKANFIIRFDRDVLLRECSLLKKQMPVSSEIYRRIHNALFQFFLPLFFENHWDYSPLLTLFEDAFSYSEAEIIFYLTPAQFSKLDQHEAYENFMLSLYLTIIVNKNEGLDFHWLLFITEQKISKNKFREIISKLKINKLILAFNNTQGRFRDKAKEIMINIIKEKEIYSPDNDSFFHEVFDFLKTNDYQYLYKKINTIPDTIEKTIYLIGFLEFLSYLINCEIIDPFLPLFNNSTILLSFLIEHYDILPEFSRKMIDNFLEAKDGFGSYLAALVKYNYEKNIDHFYKINHFILNRVTLINNFKFAGMKNRKNSTQAFIEYYKFFEGYIELKIKTNHSKYKDDFLKLWGLLKFIAYEMNMGICNKPYSNILGYPNMAWILKREANSYSRTGNKKCRDLFIQTIKEISNNELIDSHHRHTISSIKITPPLEYYTSFDEISTKRFATVFFITASKNGGPVPDHIFFGNRKFSKNPDLFCAPGGFISLQKDGGNSMKGLLREMFEETGLDLRKINVTEAEEHLMKFGKYQTNLSLKENTISNVNDSTSRQIYEIADVEELKMTKENNINFSHGVFKFSKLFTYEGIDKYRRAHAICHRRIECYHVQLPFCPELKSSDDFENGRWLSLKDIINKSSMHKILQSNEMILRWMFDSAIGNKITIDDICKKILEELRDAVAPLTEHFTAVQASQTNSQSNVKMPVSNFFSKIETNNAQPDSCNDNNFSNAQQMPTQEGSTAFSKNNFSIINSFSEKNSSKENSSHTLISSPSMVEPDEEIFFLKRLYTEMEAETETKSLEPPEKKFKNFVNHP